MRTISRSVVLFLIPLLAACGADEERVAKAPPLVRVETVAITDYAPSLTLTGAIKAQQETPLSFRTSGQITERFVDVGDHVDVGEVLARMDTEEQQADVAAAQAALDSAEAQVGQAQTAFDRQNTLLSQGLTTRSSFDTAQTALTTAIGSRDAARAQLETAQEALGYTELKATAAGIVTQRNLETDEIAQAGSPVFVIAEDGPRDAVFNVQETAVLAGNKQMSVALALVSDPSVKAEGHIREVTPTIDAQTGTVVVKVEVDDAPPAMTLGAPVTGTITELAHPSVVLPWSALWYQGGEPAIWLFDPEARTVSTIPVEIASYDTGIVVIRSGLEAGQVVVTEGAKFLIPGQVVTPLQGDAQ